VTDYLPCVVHIQINLAD